jgi:hypothetical protein
LPQDGFGCQTTDALVPLCFQLPSNHPYIDAIFKKKKHVGLHFVFALQIASFTYVLHHMSFNVAPYVFNALLIKSRGCASQQVSSPFFGTLKAQTNTLNTGIEGVKTVGLNI